jgi:hypothetical protein
MSCCHLHDVSYTNPTFAPSVVRAEKYWSFALCTWAGFQISGLCTTTLSYNTPGALTSPAAEGRSLKKLCMISMCGPGSWALLCYTVGSYYLRSAIISSPRYHIPGPTEHKTRVLVRVLRNGPHSRGPVTNNQFTIKHRLPTKKIKEIMAIGHSPRY